MNWWQRFIGLGSEEHRQVYRANKEYPIGIRYTAYVFFMQGFVVATILAFVIGRFT